MDKKISASYEATKTNESCMLYNKSEDYFILGCISGAAIICLIYFCISGEFIRQNIIRLLLLFPTEEKSFHLPHLIRKPILQLWTAYQGMSTQTGLTVSEKTLT